MDDVLMLMLGAVLSAATIALIHGLERLRGGRK
jgi:hypothetical protein